MTCCTALLTVLSTDWSALVVVGLASTTPEPLFTSELETEIGSRTNCTFGTAAAAADVEGWATGVSARNLMLLFMLAAFVLFVFAPLV